MATNAPIAQILQKHLLGLEMLWLVPKVGGFHWVVGEVEELAKTFVHEVNEFPVCRPYHRHELGVCENQVSGLLGVNEISAFPARVIFEGGENAACFQRNGRFGSRQFENGWAQVH